MSNLKTEAAAEHVDDAFATTLADVLDCDEQDVEVRIEAPGIAELRGRWRVTVSFEADPAPAAPTTDRDEGSETDAPGDDLDREVPEVPAAASASPLAARDDATGTDEALADRDEPAAGSAEDREDDTGTADADGPSDGEGGAGDHDTEDAVDALEEEAEAAADFVEGLLDALDLPGDLRIKYGDDHAEVEVIDVGSGALIGRRGQTLEAIQELLRCSLQREFQRRARVKVDVEGYRSRRLEKLLEKADEAIDAVLDTGDAERLEPMDVFERKAVHHRVAKVDGLNSRSQGREPARRVIIERD